MFSLPLSAGDGPHLNQLYGQLKDAPPKEALKIAKEIDLELSKSGSPAMDMLLRRGTDAIEAGDFAAAVDHLTALTDHAPDFAQGWHMRAVAHARLGHMGPALSDLEHTLMLSPRHFTAIYSLGALLEEVGQGALAREAFEAALALYPHDKDSAEALNRLSAVQDGTKL